MSIIEKAAKRLEALKSAGIEVPDVLPAPVREMTGTPQGAKREPLDRGPEPVMKGGARAPGGPDQPPSRSPDRADPNRADIDLDRLQAAGMVVPHAPDTKLVDELRVIKRPLIQNVRGRAGPSERPNLIMVTSAVPGEGKSFVSANLAMSMAMEVDTFVLLVDADVSGNSLPRILGVRPSGPGLLDLLGDPQITLPMALRRTNVERLSLLLAGQPHPHAAELLASGAMRALLADLASRYNDRIIVFDAPPLLATPEARALATHMGQVVVVVEAERTTHATLQNALDTIDTCPTVMTVLNKASQSEVGSYYGYRHYTHRK